MKSKPYKYNGKLFRYDFDRCMVEYIYKASKEEIKENDEWKAEHNGRPLFDIDEDGYCVTEAVGLRVENWRRKAIRDEYLSEWCFELDEEAAYLKWEFEKYELPMLKKNGWL